MKKEFPEKVLIGSAMAGYNEDDWNELTDMCNDAGFDALELNLSCPHVPLLFIRLKIREWRKRVWEDLVVKTRRLWSKSLDGSSRDLGCLSILNWLLTMGRLRSWLRPRWKGERRVSPQLTPSPLCTILSPMELLGLLLGPRRRWLMVAVLETFWDPLVFFSVKI